jgi:SLT domain-containing protein
MGGYAGGTNYAPGGWARVGERGPEDMYVPRGATIIPNERLMEAREARSGGGLSVSVQMPAGVSRQTGLQFGAEVQRGLVYAQRNL